MLTPLPAAARRPLLAFGVVAAAAAVPPVTLLEAISSVVLPGSSHVRAGESSRLLHGAIRAREGYPCGFLSGLASRQNEVVAADTFQVVVADDSNDMRELLSAALEVTGRFEVVARCRDGAE